MWQGSIDFFVWLGTNGRVVLGVFVILGNGSEPAKDLIRQCEQIPRKTDTRARFPTS